MVTGILGLVIGCFGPIPGVAAIVLGWMALSRIKNSPDTNSGKPLAIVGITTGAVCVLIYTLLIIWWLLIVGVALGTS
jgi:hypothetical protein